MIEIKYLTKGQRDFVTVGISAEDYFDLDENEVADIDSAPVYSQPFNYIDVEVSELIFLKLAIVAGDEKRLFSQTFWNNGDNFLTERIDIGKKPYKELVLTIRNEYNEHEIIRLVDHLGFTLPVYHGVITMKENGEEAERVLDTSFFVKMLKER